MSAARPPTNRPWRGARDAAHAGMLVGVALLAAGGRGDRAADRRLERGRERVRGRPLLAAPGASHPTTSWSWGSTKRRSTRSTRTGRFRAPLDARAIEVLRADHARTIVYDVQFTKPDGGTPGPGPVSAPWTAPATSCSRPPKRGPAAQRDVLGGRANLARANARVAAADFSANSSGVIQQYPYSVGGLDSVAVATAEVATGQPARRAPRFRDGSAWIDFPGPVGTVPSVSFVDLDPRPRAALASWPGRSSSSAPPARCCRTSTPPR